MDGNYQGAERTHIFSTIKPVKTVNLIYHLPEGFCRDLMAMPSPFCNGPNRDLRESVFLDNYSRATTIDPSYTPLFEGRDYPTITPEGKSKSRLSCTSRKETFADVTIRVIEGLFSHYIYHLEKCHLKIPFDEIDKMAMRMAESMYALRWTPPGRGLFAMGSNHTYLNGNSALNNCYATTSAGDFTEAMAWTMDCLMNGGGVGTDTDFDAEVIKPNKEDNFTFVIPDTRQGWVAALELLLRAYIPVSSGPDEEAVITNKFPIFDYSLIRPFGAPIRGFGGTASGPEPLIKLLKCTEIFLDAYIAWNEICPSCLECNRSKTQEEFYISLFERLRDEADIYANYHNPDEIPNLIRANSNRSMPYNKTLLVADIFNMIGWCVHSGNVRRSAEIILGDGDDPNFTYMKDWMMYAYRRPFMSNSNNTVRLKDRDDFTNYLPSIANRIRNNGEPGIANMINIKKFGRFTDTTYGPDNGDLLNPCGETIMKDKEPCCLCIVNPMNCVGLNGSIDPDLLEEACEFATFYATVVNTIPHSWACTNKVIALNRRIGVSMGGIADVYENFGNVVMVDTMKNMYRYIRFYNKKLSEDLGIPPSIRVTVVKPDGTMGLVAGTSAGVHFPIIRQGIRRVRFGDDSKVLQVLKEAGYRYQEDPKNKSTYIMYSYKSNGTRSSDEVPAWEKIAIAEEAQRHYADNSVSVTIDFDASTEGEYMEKLLTINIAKLKAVSAFPQYKPPADLKLPWDEGYDATDSNQYRFLPWQSVHGSKFEEISQNVKPVNWEVVYSEVTEDISADGVSGCTNDTCEITRTTK